MDLRDYSEKKAKSVLLASSAIPVIFDPVWVEDNFYCDGGIPLAGDNVPVFPLYDAGIRCFLVVHLSRSDPVNPDDFPDATIVEIMPRSDLGGPLDGTLDFTAEGAAWRMRQGYEDAARTFSMFINSTLRHKRQEETLRQFLTSEQFVRERERALRAERAEILTRRDNDGFEELLRTLSREQYEREGQDAESGNAY